jgi:hypothetical protein
MLDRFLQIRAKARAGALGGDSSPPGCGAWSRHSPYSRRPQVTESWGGCRIGRVANAADGAKTTEDRRIASASGTDPMREARLSEGPNPDLPRRANHHPATPWRRATPSNRPAFVNGCRQSPHAASAEPHRNCHLFKRGPRARLPPHTPLAIIIPIPLSEIRRAHPRGVIEPGLCIPSFHMRASHTLRTTSHFRDGRPGKRRAWGRALDSPALVHPPIHIRV